MKYAKGFLIVSVLSVIMSAYSVTAGTRTSNLHYELIENPNSQICTATPGVRCIAVRLWWTGPITASTNDSLTDVQALFTYDTASVSYLGAHFDSLNWNGVLYPPTVDSLQDLFVALELDIGVVMTPVQPTPYIYVHFLASCEAPNDNAAFNLIRTKTTGNEIYLEWDNAGWTPSLENYTDLTITNLSSNCVSCCQTPGDANGDKAANIADVTFLISRIFSAGAAPTCSSEADTNGDGSVNVADVTYYITHIFGAGSAPICQ